MGHASFLMQQPMESRCAPPATAADSLAAVTLPGMAQQLRLEPKHTETTEACPETGLR